MSDSGNWWGPWRRLVLLVAFAWLVGWFLGAPSLILSLGLLALLGYWLYQLQQLYSWLIGPEKPPPDAPGIWGDVYSRLYRRWREVGEQKALLHSRLDYLQDSLSSIYDGAVMVTASGAIEWSNAAAERLLGLRYPGDRGHNMLNLVRLPEFHDYFVAGDFQEPLRAWFTSGQERFLLFSVTSFGGGDRLVFVRDTTREERLEQMRRDFLGNVSHELRTPLTVISGYVDTILGNPGLFNERLQRPLQQIAQQAQRMEALLKDLLWLNRIEGPASGRHLELVDMGGLLHELREEVRTIHPQRQLDLQLDTTDKVLADYRELYSAVSNLVLNACKYSADEGLVTIKWHRSGDKLVLSVEDRGEGIDPVHLPRLTERFYRVDNSRSSRTGGTGLGLAIVKHVAASHNAELHIDSTLGVGSTFTLIFPRSGTD
ncbi:phosphate regulon sensor histidine kinase PhoR [Kineobactrum sediminis]|uniref:histidine kinase n=1 Tax=Kineobactrum sediminis TaxID=1905677 RepID=A0A2N5Y4F4_9GAMM|nr:phosphate regulon sensor histidine kinase PhoR [Kineobactrum sediminis]PLW83271.1 phosphate regulon sensor histidine kinase PhoR [Kineobactrum sediminis]